MFLNVLLALIYYISSVSYKTTGVWSIYQAILSGGAASERSFLIKSGLTNMQNYFLAKKRKNALSIVFATNWNILTYFLICLAQGGLASHREAGLLQGGRASHREGKPLAGRLGLSQGSQASYREAGPLTGRLGLLQGGRASYWEARPLTGRPSLLQGGLASDKEARPIPGRPGL